MSEHEIKIDKEMTDCYNYRFYAYMLKKAFDIHIQDLNTFLADVKTFTERVERIPIIDKDYIGIIQSIRDGAERIVSQYRNAVENLQRFAEEVKKHVYEKCDEIEKKGG